MQPGMNMNSKVILVLPYDHPTLSQADMIKEINHSMYQSPYDDFSKEAITETLDALGIRNGRNQVKRYVQESN